MNENALTHPHHARLDEDGLWHFKRNRRGWVGQRSSLPILQLAVMLRVMTAAAGAEPHPTEPTYHQWPQIGSSTFSKQRGNVSLEFLYCSVRGSDKPPGGLWNHSGMGLEIDAAGQGRPTRNKLAGTGSQMQAVPAGCSGFLLGAKEDRSQ